jgi:hypothetical protein
MNFAVPDVPTEYIEDWPGTRQVSTPELHAYDAARLSTDHRQPPNPNSLGQTHGVDRTLIYFAMEPQ